MACLLNRTALVEYLLFRGAAVDSLGMAGKTPLMTAVNACQFDVIKLLVRKTQLNILATDKVSFLFYARMAIPLLTMLNRRATMLLPIILLLNCRTSNSFNTNCTNIFRFK